MPKSFTCADAGVNCNWKGQGETEQELMQKIGAHARTAHNLAEIPQDLARKVKGAIKEEK